MLQKAISFYTVANIVVISKKWLAFRTVAINTGDHLVACTSPADVILSVVIYNSISSKTYVFIAIVRYFLIVVI